MVHNSQGLAEADNATSIGRRRALDRAMDAALKNPTKRRRRAGEVVCTYVWFDQTS